jgi:hypothetical protein
MIESLMIKPSVVSELELVWFSMILTYCLVDTALDFDLLLKVFTLVVLYPGLAVDMILSCSVGLTVANLLTDI